MKRSLTLAVFCFSVFLGGAAHATPKLAGYAARFERNGQGPATAMILERPGQADERLARKP